MTIIPTKKKINMTTCFENITIELHRGCLVCIFKQSFLGFKQYFTHFNTFFHQHVFP